MKQNGMSLVEMLVILGILIIGFAVAGPAIRAYTIESSILGAARIFHGEFLRARSIAIRSCAQTAIRFERDGDEAWYSTYMDRDGDGVLSDDIEDGTDERIAGPLPLTGRAPGVTVAVVPGTPCIPPDRCTLDEDPIRFGRSDMLSFSPLGTASPGTFYLTGQSGLLAAVRVTPGTARVRILLFNGVWRDR